MKTFPVKTPIGILHGRDAIFIDKVEMVGNQLTFRGLFNSDLTSENTSNDSSVAYILTFKNVAFFDCIEIDLFFSNIQDLGDSTFAKLENSKLIDNMKSKLPDYTLGNHENFDKHSHFILITYEYVFNIVATDFTIDSNNKITSPKLPMVSIENYEGVNYDI